MYDPYDEEIEYRLEIENRERLCAEQAGGDSQFPKQVWEELFRCDVEGEL